jgi:hypothetical protein
VRNIFDQYAQPENQLTHAVVSSLGADPALLRKFIRWVCGERPPSRRLEVIEQRLPGEEELIDETEVERRGLPDAWIHDGNTWALILENKIQAPLRASQLARHRRMAERRGFSDTRLASFVTERPKRLAFDGLRVIEWTELYAWLRKERTSEWARRLTEYMEVLERKLAEEEYLREGVLTVFAGIPFGRSYPYNYQEAKRLLRLALESLRERRDLRRAFGVNRHAEGRAAITGRGGTSVWDFLPLAKARGHVHTEFPHLTLGIHQDRIEAVVTVPNGIRREFRRKLLEAGKDRFLELFGKIHDNLQRSLGRVEGIRPWVEITQRHFPSQRSAPIVDARLRFDLRTAFRRPKRWRKSVKGQPQWIEAAYEGFARRRSNLQLAVGAIFEYERCPSVHSPEILDHVAAVWLACKPLVRTAVE